MRLRFRTTRSTVTFNSVTSNVEYPQGLDNRSTMLMPAKELARLVTPADIKKYISDIISAFVDFCEENTSATIEQQDDDTIAVNELRELCGAVNSRTKVSLVSGAVRVNARTTKATTLSI